MSKHTPGPWSYKIASDEDFKYPDQVEFEFVGPFTGSGQVDVDSLFGSVPDARLVAAAPEMLEALRSVHKCYFLHSEYPKICALVDAAIAKAEGGV